MKTFKKYLDEVSSLRQRKLAMKLASFPKKKDADDVIQGTSKLIRAKEKLKKSQNDKLKSRIEERVTLPKAGKKLGLKRTEMPQITHKMHKEFFAFLKDKGVSTTQKRIDPNELKPSQTQFSKQKIEGMMKSIEDGSYKPKPIIVSKDNYVIDGHHNWIAHMNLNRDMLIAKVDVAAKELFDLMHEFPKSYTKKVHE